MGSETKVKGEEMKQTNHFKPHGSENSSAQLQQAGREDEG